MNFFSKNERFGSLSFELFLFENVVLGPNGFFVIGKSNCLNALDDFSLKLMDFSRHMGLEWNYLIFNVNSRMSKIKKIVSVVKKSYKYNIFKYFQN